MRKFTLGLIKPDSFAFERFSTLPPGARVLLIFFNRYHNFVARKLAT